MCRLFTIWRCWQTACRSDDGGSPKLRHGWQEAICELADSGC